MANATSHPLQVPILVITPSTPTDETPLIAGRPRLNIPRNQPLLHSSSAIHTAVRTRPKGPHPNRILTQYGGTYVQSYPLGSPLPSTPDSRTRRGRSRDRAGEGAFPLHGRGTTASLILITAAFLLVIMSILMNPETVVKMIRHSTDKVGDARNSLIALWSADGVPQRVKWAVSAESTTRMVVHPGSQEMAGDDLEVAGPAVSYYAWKTYMRKRQQMMGLGEAESSSLLEAWDFHG